MTATGSAPATAVPDPLAVAILWDGYAADTFLDSVDGVGSQFAQSPSGVKERALDAVRWLLENGLIRLYSVDKTRAPGDREVPWEGSVAEQVARLDSVYTNEVADWHVWGYSCWFSNTESGDALAEQYPPEPWSDDDE